jgi:PleD family two-component response regulator
LAEVGILVVEDDIASQRAIKNVLDAEGWRVRILPVASHLMAELATGNWSLIIVNVALIDLRGPLFSTLKDLAQAEATSAMETTDGNALPVAGNTGKDTTQPRPKGLRVLFLVPTYGGQRAQVALEREELPYTLKPYHLHDFLEKVSELLVEAGALAEPMRTMGTALGRKRRKNDARVSRDTRRGAMFASREDYQMTEEEMADFERQEEEDRKKREKELQDRYHR